MAKERRVPKRGVFPWGGAGLILLFWVMALPAQAQDLAGRVVSVHDGDTATVLDAGKVRHKIRLAGIDAPELGQPFGRVSRDHLASRIQGKRVIVHWRKHDRYGRIVGTIQLDGTDMNIDQLHAGLAWHFKRYAHEQPRDERATYADAEVRAQAAHLGLWRERDQLPPWEYRKTKKSRAKQLHH